MAKCELHDTLAAELACRILNETGDMPDACCVLESVIVVVLGKGLDRDADPRLAYEVLDVITASVVERLGPRG